jgi:hypothetical protein
MLHVLLAHQAFEQRTSQSMQNVYQQALHAPTKVASEKIFQTHGLHLSEVCLLRFISRRSLICVVPERLLGFCQL